MLRRSSTGYYLFEAVVACACMRFRMRARARIPLLSTSCILYFFFALLQRLYDIVWLSYYKLYNKNYIIVNLCFKFPLKRSPVLVPSPLLKCQKLSKQFLLVSNCTRCPRASIVLSFLMVLRCWLRSFVRRPLSFLPLRRRPLPNLLIPRNFTFAVNE